MSGYNPRGAAAQYSSVATESEVFSASPHRLVQMLLEGALDKIAASKGFLEREDLVQKNHHVTWAISIINGLRMSLDHEGGGEIAGNLDDLYEYMCRRLLEVTRDNDVAKLDEVSSLLLEIKSGWDAINPAANNAAAASARPEGGITESA